MKTAKKSGIPVKERQKMRNLVSAQQSRIKKKEEVIHLKQCIKAKNENLRNFLNLITQHFDTNILQEKIEQ